jgi:hypothetical protein
LPVRSVTELLPRPFSELMLGDVEQIVAAVGEERESLFFERKASISHEALAKACAAFANSFGGLLLVGVSDTDDDLVGVERPAAEPQVWVKDVVRPRVIPLPPFRARLIPVGSKDGRALILVLVEESAATPHLLTRQGAIYVRNPGSSDPVPIADQQRLLLLFERGQQARESAVERAHRAYRHIPPRSREVLTLAATGVPASFEDRLFESDYVLDLLRKALSSGSTERRDDRGVEWSRDSVQLNQRVVHPPPYDPTPETITVWRDGTVSIAREAARGDELAVDSEAFLGRVRRYLVAGLEALLELGAHGDANLFYVVSDTLIEWRARSRVIQLEGPGAVRRWIPVSPDDRDVERLLTTIFAELARSGGIGPAPNGRGWPPSVAL